jgi:hypothetical protein
MSALLNQYGVEQQKLGARQAESNRALDLAFEESIADVPAAKLASGPKARRRTTAGDPGSRD